MVGGKSSEMSHTELQSPRIQRDEQAVAVVVGLIKKWINPFTEKQNLVNISTVRVAPHDITLDLLNVK
jgi:hypothetical protein